MMILRLSYRTFSYGVTEKITLLLSSYVEILKSPEWLIDESLRGNENKQAENGLQSRSSENGNTAVWHYGLKLH